MLTLTRRYPFSAAHRLWNDALSEAENHQHFGPCVRLHGHNYTLEVTVTGQPDPQTGMILDIVALDDWVKQQILDHVDHRHLDEDVPMLHGTLSTVENVVQIFYHRLHETCPAPARLHAVRLFESDQNWAAMTANEFAKTTENPAS